MLAEGVANFAKQKQLLAHSLRLSRQQENHRDIASALCSLSRVNGRLELYEEGIQQAKEALGIYEQLGDMVQQGTCWGSLAALFIINEDKLDAAEDARLRSIGLLPEKGEEFNLCESYLQLGIIYLLKHERQKAIRQFEIVLGIASAFKWSEELYRINVTLGVMLTSEGELDDATARICEAKSHAVDRAHDLACAMRMQADVFLEQRRFEDAKSEARDALEIFEGLGAEDNSLDIRNLLLTIEKGMAGKFSLFLVVVDE